MAEPTEGYDWATNANYAGGPDVGTVTKVVPTAAQEADGWRGDQKPPGQYQNHWQNAIAKWTDWTRAMFAGTEDLDAFPTREIFIGASEGDGDAGWPAGVGADRRTGNVDLAQLYIDISSHLPSGAVLSQVELMVIPGAVRAGGNRMFLQVFRLAYSVAFTGLAVPAQTQLGATVEDDGTTNVQLLDRSGLAETIDRDVNAIVCLLSAGDTATASPDRYIGLRVTFTDPGPRNF